MDRLRQIIREIHRRSVWQVVGIYLAGSWVAFEIVSTFTESLALPPWVPGFALVLLVVGLPVVIATAFVQEGPPGEKDVAVAGREPSEAGADVAARSSLEDAGSGSTRVSDERASTGLLTSLLTWRHALLGGVVAFSLLFGIAGLYVLFQDGGDSLPLPEARADDAAPAIAVLPFETRGENLGTLREGMVDILSHALDGAAGLRGISPRTVLARWRELVPADVDADLETHLRAAREAGARYALVGSAIGLAQDARLVADVYEVGSGERVASGSVEGDAGDPGGLADRLAVETLKALVAGGETFPEVDVGRILTDSPQALRAYLNGERDLRRFELEGAAAAFRRALEADSAFALAHWRLVEVHSWGSTYNATRRSEHLWAAHRHRDRLTARDSLMVAAMMAPTRTGVELLRSAVRRYPDEAFAWYRLGETLVHGPELRPTAVEIERAFRRAIERDPRRPSFYPHAVMMALAVRRDSARTAELTERFAQIAQPVGSFEMDVDPRAASLAHRLAFGDSLGRTQTFAALDTLPPGADAATASYLVQPADWPMAARLLERELRRDEPSELRTPSRRVLAHGRLLYEGRVEAALELMQEEPDDASMPPALDYFGFWWPVIFHRARVAGLPVPDSTLDRLMTPYLEDSGAPARVVLLAGAWAYTSGNRQGLERAREILRERASGMQERDSTSAAEVVRRHRRLLDARVALGEGRVGEAMSVLQEDGDGTWAVQWWWGETAMRAGRYEEAAEIYGTYAGPETYRPFTLDPPVRSELARALEALGRYEEAARAYRHFAEHWAEAHLDVQPRVERARERAVVLSGAESTGGGG